MKKERLKGFVAGILLMAMLSSVLVFANSGIMREVHYGINVVLNGRAVEFEEDSRPFVIDGRTFLPLRAMAELLGLPVEFDAETNTAYVGYANPADLLIGRWTDFEYYYHHSIWGEYIDFFADGTVKFTRINRYSGVEFVDRLFKWSADGDLINVVTPDSHSEEDGNWEIRFNVFRSVLGGDELLTLSGIYDGRIMYTDLAIRIND